MTTPTTGIEKARAYMQGALIDPMHLAAAIDVVMHPTHAITLLRETGELAPLTAYAIVAYTLVGANLQPAWSVAIYEGKECTDRQVFPERVKALQYATDRGFCYVSH